MPAMLDSPASPRCAVVIPAFNEETTIAAVIDRVHQSCNAYVIVVDDASQDQTIAEARRAGARVICLPQRLGAWGAIQTGLRYALKNDYAIAITMDADGQHDPGFIPALLQPIEQNQAEVTIGAAPARVSNARRLAWRWFRMLTGLKIEDITSGFRAYNRSAMRIMIKSAASLLDYQDVGVLLMLRNGGQRIIEVPVAMQARANGKSRVFSSWLIVAKYMAHTSLLALARMNRPQSKHYLSKSERL
ncbi:MAG: glycosyltransferase family 2 protein [Gammaproteobacteria bacterium]